MITGGRLYPDEDIQSMAVTYSRFPGYIDTGLPLSALVITLAIKMTPI
jgi:hypothetical protein